VVKYKVIRLAKPQFSEQAIEKVSEVLKSGNLVQGKYVIQFEHEIKKYLNIKHAVVVSSGTAALHLSLLALDIGPGDEVIVPAFSFPATANVVEAIGAKVVFIDIKLEDFCIDVTLIEAAITDRTKAIMPVHEFGQSADMTPILRLAKKHNLKIVEDAACALGCEYNNQKVGTFGELGCFSFHPRKAITTGEGGVVVTNSDQFAVTVRSLRNHGISNINNSINFLYAGINYRMTDFQAVLGIDQLIHIDSDIAKREKLAKLYYEGFEQLDWFQLCEKFENRKNVFQTYHGLVLNNQDRNAVIANLMSHGIESNIGAYAIHMIDYYKSKYNFSAIQYPNAKIAFENGLALPIGNHINQENVSQVINALLKWGN